MSAAELVHLGIVLRSMDGGLTWQAHRVETGHHGDWTTHTKSELVQHMDQGPEQECIHFSNTDSDSIYRCLGQEGQRHIVVLVAEDKHGNYLTESECDSERDACNGGTQLMIPLPTDASEAARFNVGEPDDQSTVEGVSWWDCDSDGSNEAFYGRHLLEGDIGFLTQGFYLEWLWRKEYQDSPHTPVFCGGMRSAWMRCEAFDPFFDCVGFEADDPECLAVRASFCLDHLLYPDRFVGDYVDVGDMFVGISFMCGGGVLEEQLSFAPWCPCGGEP